MAFLSSEAVLGDLRDAFYEEFMLDPIRFFERFVMPLMPKQSLIALQASINVQSGDVLEALRAKVLESANIPGEIIDALPQART